MNAMQTIRIEKVTLNIGAGKDQTKLEKGIALIKAVTGIEPVKTITNKRIAAWGLRPGLPIGCKLTMRKQSALQVLARLLAAKENKLKPENFDDCGNLSFGIAEYIDIPGVTYDPKIGVLGLQICVTLERPGYRIKRRKWAPKKIPKRHVVAKEESMAFFKNQFKVSIEGAE
ncbi:MAG: 50S ribosomal protein L5 [Candidatus Aenigmarchaeota archaeon]|nr:50S ribosomal protein L5 [Candidatus Aenigmarchaeota archaeon]